VGKNICIVALADGGITTAEAQVNKTNEKSRVWIIVLKDIIIIRK
jgi:hypothetical protein